MKKIILSGMLLVGAVTGVNAQISAGTTLLGGGISYSAGNQKRDDYTFNNVNYPGNKDSHQQLNVTPTVGYFVSENLAVGLNIGYSFARYRLDNAYPAYSDGQSLAYSYRDTQRERIISAGPIVRYYKFVSDKAAFYGQAGIGYQNNYNSFRRTAYNTGYDFYPETSGSGRSQGYFGRISPGFVSFPTNKLGLELNWRGLSYQRTTRKDKLTNSETVNNYFDAGLSLSYLQLGASFYLGRN